LLIHQQRFESLWPAGASILVLGLHLVALAVLAGDVELVSRLRHAALESRMDALLLNADSSSQAPPATGSNEVKLWRF
jgi:hypothetical protein